MVGTSGLVRMVMAYLLTKLKKNSRNKLSFQVVQA